MVNGVRCVGNDVPCGPTSPVCATYTWPGRSAIRTTLTDLSSVSLNLSSSARWISPPTGSISSDSTSLAMRTGAGPEEAEPAAPAAPPAPVPPAPGTAAEPAGAPGTLDTDACGTELSDRAGDPAAPVASGPRLRRRACCDDGASRPPNSDGWPLWRCQASHRNSSDIVKINQRIVRCALHGGDALVRSRSSGCARRLSDRRDRSRATAAGPGRPAPPRQTDCSGGSKASGSGSTPPSFHGWQRNSRRPVSHRPRSSPSRSSACRPYSEQLG